MRRVFFGSLSALVFLSPAKAAIEISFDVPAPYSSYGSPSFIVESDHGPDLYQITVSIVGGPFVTHYGILTDFGDYSSHVVNVWAGSAYSRYFGCNESDFHCERANIEKFGIGNSGEAISVNYFASTDGPYAFLGPATVNITIEGNGFFIVGVPEPSTWAMMLIGFLGIGLLTSGRQKIAVRSLKVI